MMPTRILYCGSRTWIDVVPWLRINEAHQRQRDGYLYRGPLARIMAEQIHNDMVNNPNGIVLIEGEAPGADLMARKLADGPGFTVEPYPADWRRHGSRAGPLRNEQMAREGRPAKARGFISGKVGTPLSRGSAGMLAILDRLGIPTIVHREDGVERGGA